MKVSSSNVLLQFFILNSEFLLMSSEFRLNLDFQIDYAFFENASIS
jgi:hypothetical protein